MHTIQQSTMMVGKRRRGKTSNDGRKENNEEKMHGPQQQSKVASLECMQDFWKFVHLLDCSCSETMMIPFMLVLLLL
jgi:hypothetical protein